MVSLYFWVNLGARVATTLVLDAVRDSRARERYEQQMQDRIQQEHDRAFVREHKDTIKQRFNDAIERMELMSRLESGEQYLDTLCQSLEDA
jgi:hypothetical protein